MQTQTKIQLLIKLSESFAQLRVSINAGEEEINVGEVLGWAAREIVKLKRNLSESTAQCDFLMKSLAKSLRE